MKLGIKIVFLLLLVAGSVIGGWFLFTKQPQEPSKEGNISIPEKTVGTGGGILKNVPAENTESFRKNFGKSEILTIKTDGEDVTVPNFYRTAPFINKYGHANLVIADEYTITYIPEIPMFYITISSEDVPGAIKNAEEAFLNLLKISKPRACELDVSVSVESDFDPEGRYDYVKNLSFCPPR